MNVKNIILITCFILTLTISQVCAFSDSFENHWDTAGDGYGTTGQGEDDLMPTWNIDHHDLGTHTYDVRIKNCGATYSSTLYIYSYRAGYVYVRNNISSPSIYWAFTLRNEYHSDPLGPALDYKIVFYNNNGYYINNYDIESLFKTSHNNARYEIYIENNVAYLKINGTAMGTLGSCTEIPAYIEFYIKTWDFTSISLCIDDVTTESGIVGISMDAATLGGFMNHTFTELSNKEMDVSWATQTIPEESYITSEYTLKVKSVNTGEFLNTTIIKNAGNSTQKPCGFVTYNYSNLLGTKYGLYLFEIYADSIPIKNDYILFKEIGDTSWLNLEYEQYGISDTMLATYWIKDPDFEGYVYYVATYDNTGELKDMQTLEGPSDSGSVNISTNEFQDGLVYTTLIKDTEPYMNYDDNHDLIIIGTDIANLLDAVFLKGTCYNAETGAALPNVTINITQGSHTEGIVSDSNGSYAFTYKQGMGSIPTNETISFVTSVPIQFNASKQYFWHDNFSFTPLVPRTYTTDLYLIPECDNLTHTGNCIAGSVVSYPFHQKIGDASVNIWRYEFTNNTTSSESTGFYIFDDLIPSDYEDYSINATKNKYTTSETYRLSVSGGECVYQNIILHGLYNLTVQVKDISTGTLLSNFDATLKDTTTLNSGNNTNVVFTNVEYGLWKVVANHEGYYSGTKYAYVAEDTSITIYLTKTPTAVTGERGSGVQYPTHIVEFRVQSMTGAPYNNINISITPTETTMSSWDWLVSIFGFANTTAPLLQNETQSTTTDSHGTASFVMVQTIKYCVNVNSSTQGINETHYLYPKEQQYTLIIIGAKTPSLHDSVEWNLTSAVNGTDFLDLGLAYNDILNKTSNVYFYVSDSNDVILHSTNISSSSVTTKYTVTKSKGLSYYWGFKSTHQTFGEIRQDKAITCHSRLIDLELQNESYYTWISIALLVMITTLFSAATVKLGTIIVPFIGGFFNWIGWMAITPLILSCVIVIGVLLYLQKTEHDKRY